jgi:molecular chaperone GrpE
MNSGEIIRNGKNEDRTEMEEQESSVISAETEAYEDKPIDEYSREELIEALSKAQKNKEENFELYLRAQADMENMKKRHQKEKREWQRFANEKLIKEILPVLDNLENALCHTADGQCITSLQEGVELTLKGLRGALEQAGVQEIRAQGEDFDPCFHEAISIQEDPNLGAGKVLKELQKGYVLNDRLIRPSLVIVNKECSGEDKAFPS